MSRARTSSNSFTVIRSIGIVALAATSLAACGGEEEFDPVGSAEIGIHDQILVELQLDSEVVCDDPPSTDVGATFDCLATDEDGKEYHFVAQIMEGEIIGTRLA